MTILIIMHSEAAEINEALIARRSLRFTIVSSKKLGVAAHMIRQLFFPEIRLSVRNIKNVFKNTHFSNSTHAGSSKRQHLHEKMKNPLSQRAHAASSKRTRVQTTWSPKWFAHGASSKRHRVSLSKMDFCTRCLFEEAPCVLFQK